MLEILMLLLGTWKGEGAAVFPTIASQDYFDEITFALDDPHNVIQYEQKTWRKESQRLLHWEFGFIRVLDDGMIALNNTQNNGRLEVMKGQLTTLQTGFRLALITRTFSNDPRMVQASREWTVEGHRLTYTQAMATQKVPRLQPHLRSTLDRC